MKWFCKQILKQYSLKATKEILSLIGTIIQEYQQKSGDYKHQKASVY